MNKLTTYPLGKVGANWLQTLNKLSICLPGKTPSAPSGYQRARRTKPYQTARKTCCGGRGVETEEAVASEGGGDSCSRDSSSSKSRVNWFHHLKPNRELRHTLRRAGVKLNDQSSSECSSDERSSSGGSTPRGKVDHVARG